MEKRIQNAQAEMGKTDENGERLRREMSFRQNVDKSWRTTDARKAVFASTLRLILILGLLCVVFYYVYQKLDIFVEKLM